MPGFAEFHSDEREQLLAYLAVQREVLRLSSYGLTDEQARLRPSASSLSVGGVIKHVSEVEAYWIDMVMRRQPSFGASQDYEAGFLLEVDETLEGVIGRYSEVALETERVVRSLPVDHPVPVPHDVPWFPSDLDSWTLRWVLLHLIEETARHAGHADIVRESIDGATWFPLMSAAEGWDMSPWVEPWKPPAS